MVGRAGNAANVFCVSLLGDSGFAQMFTEQCCEKTVAIEW
jgi:hypothetical protein